MDLRTAIFNQVLIKLGITGRIEHYNDITTEATTINDVYDSARDYVLKDFDWGFASTYGELSLARNMNSDNYSNFKYVYFYPADCIAARSLTLKNDKTERAFDIGTGDNGRSIIYADVNPAILRYTKRIETEAQYTPEFQKALVLYLAAETAEALTGSAQKASIKLNEYEHYKRHCQKLNANEGRAKDEDDTTYIDKRF